MATYFSTGIGSRGVRGARGRVVFCLILVRSVSVPACIISDLTFSERRIPSCGSGELLIRPLSPLIQVD
jgi:hypothetical protein